jgi:hypothetical protein
VTVAASEDAGVPAVEVRKLAARGALIRHGQGVYTHRDVPPSLFTQPAIAVALGGEGAFLQREAVLDLLGLGQFNPKVIRVGTRHRVRRTLPPWMSLEHVAVPEKDMTAYEGIACTTVRRVLDEMKDRMPRERWMTLVDETIQRELIEPDEAVALIGDVA